MAYRVTPARYLHDAASLRPDTETPARTAGPRGAGGFLHRSGETVDGERAFRRERRNESELRRILGRGGCLVRGFAPRHWYIGYIGHWETASRLFLRSHALSSHTITIT